MEVHDSSQGKSPERTDRLVLNPYPGGGRVGYTNDGTPYFEVLPDCATTHGAPDRETAKRRIMEEWDSEQTAERLRTLEKREQELAVERLRSARRVRVLPSRRSRDRSKGCPGVRSRGSRRTTARSTGPPGDSDGDTSDGEPASRSRPKLDRLALTAGGGHG